MASARKNLQRRHRRRLLAKRRVLAFAWAYRATATLLDCMNRQPFTDPNYVYFSRISNPNSW
jgi:hypothetical protein